MSDTVQLSTPVVQSARLLELSPELIDMILIECYREILLSGETVDGPPIQCVWSPYLRAPVRGWLSLDFEKTCRSIRNRALAVRTLAFERTVIVKKYWAFDNLIYGLSSSGRFAWLSRGLASIKIDDTSQPSILDPNWGKLLLACPRLKEIHFTVTKHRRLRESRIRSYQSLELEDNERALARAIVKGDVPMESFRGEVFCTLSELELRNTVSTQKRDIKSQAVVRITFVSDKDRTKAVEVV